MVGRRVGSFELGIADGLAVGFAVGRVVGWEVGRAVGRTDGVLVGTPVGGRDRRVITISAPPPALLVDGAAVIGDRVGVKVKFTVLLRILFSIGIGALSPAEYD